MVLSQVSARFFFAGLPSSHQTMTDIWECPPQRELQGIMYKSRDLRRTRIHYSCNLFFLQKLERKSCELSFLLEFKTTVSGGLSAVLRTRRQNKDYFIQTRINSQHSLHLQGRGQHAEWVPSSWSLVTHNSVINSPDIWTVYTKLTSECWRLHPDGSVWQTLDKL